MIIGHFATRYWHKKKSNLKRKPHNTLILKNLKKYLTLKTALISKLVKIDIEDKFCPRIGKEMKRTLLLTILATNLFLGCRPEKEATNFNELIDVPIGEEKELQAKEDQDLDFEYAIPKNENSIDLKLSIHKMPTNGQLLNCHTTEDYLKCTYRPNKNFYGSDVFEVIGQDGDLKAKQSSVVKINVIDVPDAPKALDKSFTTGSKQELSIILPQGSDPDSLSTELSYSIVDGPGHGELKDCSGRKCTYISESLYDGVDSFTYQIIDNTGLSSNIAKIEINVNKVTFNTSETFNTEVDSLKGVDIVWVIDNSGSMRNEQITLQNNFDSFINNFLVNGKARFKFNMAITVTDLYAKNNSNPFAVDSNGNTYDLSSNRAELNFTEFSADFKRAVNVGINGGGREKALLSADQAYVKDPSWYANNDHLLVYIILSDEREQSTEKTIQQHFNNFTSLKDKPEKVLFYPIINPNTDIDSRYAELAQLSGTQVYDINSSFQNILDNISLNVSTNIKSYDLNKNVAIVPSSVKVSVNGVNTEGFTYLNNTITFENPPQGNAKIVVNYDYGAL